VLGRGQWPPWQVPENPLPLSPSSYKGDKGQATNAELYAPIGIAFDSNGNLFIADSNNNRIREVKPAPVEGLLSDGTITTVAGDGTAGDMGDGLAATAAELNGPSGVALDGSDLLIADSGNNVIREVTPGTEGLADGTIMPFAGTGESGALSYGNLATDAELDDPTRSVGSSTGTRIAS